MIHYIATALALLAIVVSMPVHAQKSQKKQVIELNGRDSGPRFDGIGAVNGGGATSVLLKDYPETQRQQIMDMVYKPMFGASVSSLLVEIPGDGNSTQGSMPSHSHYRGDFNYSRGYMWWVLREAKKRNPRLSLDATGWSAPGWVGNGKFFSQDGADYYIAWLKGLRQHYGLELDAIGCRNEKGESASFAVLLKKALMDNGFENVRLHGWDNWPKNKLDFLPQLLKDTTYRNAFDIISAHTFSHLPVTAEQRQMIRDLNKPLWNSEDHIYLKGFAALIGIVESFNRNYIESGATKIINWYDIAGVYPMEPYSEDPPMLLAREPWSGYYKVREALWGYAHYGQFSEVGWHYVDAACKNLSEGGSVVTLKSPDGDYSIIIETRDAKQPQTVEFKLTKGMKKATLCLWRSNAKEQFVRLADITPKGGRFTLHLDTASVYSLSTTTGQRKGGYDNIPTPQAFPMPYSDDFDGYGKPEQWGYLPRYTADICGCFELVSRPDGDGQCIRQVVGEKTISWAPDWHHFTILGDSAWADYEVASDVYLNPADEGGIMGRVCHVGTGWGFEPKGYYLKLSDTGKCSIVITRGKKDKKKLVGDAEQQAAILASSDNSVGGEKVLAETQLEGISSGQWHNMRLRFEGATITALIDGNEVLAIDDTTYPKGMAGLLAVKGEKNVSTPYFDNLTIKPLGTTPVSTPRAVASSLPLY